MMNGDTISLPSAMKVSSLAEHFVSPGANMCRCVLTAGSIAKVTDDAEDCTAKLEK